MNLGKLGVWYFTETMPAAKAAEAANRIEALGYAWVEETQNIAYKLFLGLNQQ